MVIDLIGSVLTILNGRSPAGLADKPCPGIVEKCVTARDANRQDPGDSEAVLWKL